VGTRKNNHPKLRYQLRESVDDVSQFSNNSVGRPHATCSLMNHEGLKEFAAIWKIIEHWEFDGKACGCNELSVAWEDGEIEKFKRRKGFSRFQRAISKRGREILFVNDGNRFNGFMRINDSNLFF
jgi:hypothetical protein